MVLLFEVYKYINSSYKYLEKQTWYNHVILGYKSGYLSII